MTFKKIATLDQIPTDRGLGVEIDGTRIALFNVEGEIRAMEAACARHAAPLDRGAVDQRTLYCPWHGAPFDLDTGVCSEFPDLVSARVLPVRVQGNDVLVDC